MVVEPAEIRLALDLLGLRAERSLARQHEERWYDCILARGAEGEREVWFDVTAMQEWLAEAN